MIARFSRSIATNAAFASLLFLGVLVHGATGTDLYVRGLQQITSAQYAEAATTLQEAIDANDEDANYHLARAIALMLARDGKAAGPHLERARRLDARHPAVPVWAYLYYWTYGPPLRDSPEVPHSSREPYKGKLINATTQYRSMLDRGQTAYAEKAWKEVEQCAAEWAWSQLARPEMLQAQAASLDTLFAQKDYTRCLGIVSRLLNSNPTDVRLLSISAGSKVALGDNRGARTDFTSALRFAPTRADLLVGRSLAAARMAALRTADGDRAMALQLNPKLLGQPLAELDKAIKQTREHLPKETGESLLNALQNAAKNSSENINTFAEKLVRSDAAERLYPDEAFSQELSRLQHNFDQAPRDVEAAVALAAFCIRPNVEIPVRLTTNKRMTRVRVGEPDLDRARVALDAAGKLGRNHHGALTQQALWMQAKGAKQRMIQAVEYAFEQGALNYDLAKMYLDYYQELAASQEQEAAFLRAPTVTYEERVDGRYRITTPPSASALARAAQLEAQAKENRRKSMQPLQKFAAANSKTPFGKLAEAELARMVGEYNRMVQLAEAALEIDPWHLEAREYLVEYCPKIGMNERALEHQDILNNLMGPSARITIGSVPTLLEQTRYTSALQRLKAGEKKEPASGRVATLRGIILSQAGKRDEAEAAFRVAAAMETARLALASTGDHPLWSANDAALALAIQKAWASVLEGTHAAEAWNQLATLIHIAEGVPQSQWNQELPATQLPTVFKWTDDKRRTGMRVREMVVDAQLSGAKLLAALDRLDEAAHLLVVCKETSEPMASKPPVDAIAFPVIQKMGVERAAKIFPPLMMEGYQVMSRFGQGPRETFRGTETLGKEGVRQQWIDARLKEIDQDLELLLKSQTLTAMRKREELTQEKEQLTTELQQLKSQPSEPQQTPQTRRRRGTVTP